MKSAIQEQASGAREGSGTLASTLAANVRRAVIDMHSAGETSYGRLHQITNAARILPGDRRDHAGFSAAARFAAGGGSRLARFLSAWRTAAVRRGTRTRHRLKG